MLLVVAVATSGCIKIDQTMSLNNDGSGELDIRYGMSEQAIAQLKAMEQMGAAMGDGEGVAMEADTPFDFDFDEAKVREEFEAQAIEGVELLSATSETLDGWRYMRMKLRFDSLSALKQTDFFDESELSLTRDADGHYVLTQRASDQEATEAVAAADDEMTDEMLQQMATMFAGMRIANRVVVPTEIIETNATEVEGRTAAWVYDIDKNPKVMKELEQLNMRVVFSGEGVSIPD
jgi:hypothetical protein